MTRNRIFELLMNPPSAREAAQGRAQIPRVMLGLVIDGGSIPTTTGRYVLVHPGRVTGVKVEGQTVAYKWNTEQKIPVAIIGNVAPKAGDILQCYGVENRWAATGGTSCNWTFVVRGCNNTSVLGCVVSVKQGGVEIATCTGSGCILSVPPGTYDVTVTPPVGSGYGTYSATLTHTCAQTTNVNLTPNADSLCVDSCGPCPLLPKSIAITFNTDPPPCAQWQDVTVVLDPTYPIQPTWVSTTPVLVDSFGREFTLIFQCSPFQRYEIGAIHPGSPTNFIGFRDFAPPTGISCTPFSFTGGLIGFPGGPYCGTWSALGS